MNLKKFFIISDIHSHYSSMIEALNKAQYDEDNPQHHLLVLGDLFDRGNEGCNVLEYLYQLSSQEKATIILGNHDAFLLDFLDGNFEKVGFNIKHNGFGNTLKQLSDLDPKNSDFELIHKSIVLRYPFLHNWLKSFPLYIEIENYIFVHGGVDGGKLDWKTMSSRRDFVWSREHDLPRVLEKTVVAGHHRVATIRKKTTDYNLLFLHHPEMFDILYEEGKILIDRYVEVSKEINVLILELKA